MKLPLSGVWTANQKYIPLWALGAGGCEILLSLQRPGLAAIHTLDGAAQSQAYHLEDIRCEVDLISIDSELMERYSRNLQEGGSLMLHTKLWNVTQVFVAGNSGDFEVTLSKALSRLATMFVNFSQELTEGEQQTGEMYSNTFKCYPQAYEILESFATIGSKRYPEFPVKGITSHFFKLTQALGIAKSIAHSVNTDVDSYADDSFVLGIDFENARWWLLPVLTRRVGLRSASRSRTLAMAKRTQLGVPLNVPGFACTVKRSWSCGPLAPISSIR